MKLIYTLGLCSLMSTQAFPAITFSGLNPVNGSIVDVSDGAGNGTTYSGTWSESNTGASGGWSVTITYTGTGGDTLNWEPNAGASVGVGSGNLNGGGLVLDFRGGALNGVDVLNMEFSMTADPGSSVANITYAVGPVNGSFPDWGDAVLNTGGTEIADTGGGQTANYNPATGFIDPSPGGQANTNHNWYISFGSGTTLNWTGDNLQRDTHIFGASEAFFVPEPSSTALLGLGGLAMILRRRK
ncbi:PEP-CTERM sorting domain-containing protein [Oceaniferula spumae]